MLDHLISLYVSTTPLLSWWTQFWSDGEQPTSWGIQVDDWVPCLAQGRSDLHSHPNSHHLWWFLLWKPVSVSPVWESGLVQIPTIIINSHWWAFLQGIENVTLQQQCLFAKTHGLDYPVAAKWDRWQPTWPFQWFYARSAKIASGIVAGLCGVFCAYHEGSLGLWNSILGFWAEV